MRLSLCVAAIVAGMIGTSNALPSRRQTDSTCPYLFNEEGNPSINDFRDGDKSVDIGSMAVAAALVYSSREYVAGLFKYLYQDKYKPMEYPSAPTTATIFSKSGGGACQPFPREAISFEGSGGDKEKETNSITVELRGYEMVDEELPYYFVSYENNDLSSNQYGDNALHSAWVYIFQQSVLKYAQRDAELGKTMKNLWPNTDVSKDSLTANTHQFNASPPQIYKNLGRMLKLVTGQEAAQKLVKDVQDDELRKILDSAPGSPVLVIPKPSDTAQKLDSHRIWIGMKETSGDWSFVNPLEKEEARVTLSLEDFKASAEEIAYLKDHSALKV